VVNPAALEQRRGSDRSISEGIVVVFLNAGSQACRMTGSALSPLHPYSAIRASKECRVRSTRVRSFGAGTSRRPWSVTHPLSLPRRRFT
jgi:hypothetical protein